jgi:hypothetical protein
MSTAIGEFYSVQFFHLYAFFAQCAGNNAYRAGRVGPSVRTLQVQNRYTDFDEMWV